MHVVILGNGITGVTAARTVRKLDSTVRITMVSGESDHHFSRPALMYVYMGHMRYRDTKPYEDHFWARNRIELRRAWVTRIDAGAKHLELDDGSKLPYDRLLLATGSVPNRFGWPGQDLKRVHGMYSLLELIELERNTAAIRHGVVVGGGLIGIELAEMLHSRGRHVTLLVREDEYWDNVLPTEEARMVGRAIRAAGIELRLKTELGEILDDGTGACGGVVTKAGDRIDCQFVGLTAGVRPNVTVAADSGIETKRGIAVNGFLETSAPDVWAAGDCAHVHPEGGEPFLEQVWYTGRAQGEVVARNLLGERVAYARGIWFNSAKFLDLEYQIYGEIPNRPVAGVGHLYWEHPDGARSVRICHRDGAFIGLQAMGIRYRHRVCEAWIRSAVPVDQVVQQLHLACFDPELFPRYESALRSGLREVSP
ncbi:MAG: FAD/NAD(P)-binding oxidoreductase [Myxococcota bacterium]